jgi:hypothetical protein
LRASANMARGTIPVSTNEEMAEVKKRMTTAVIATPPIAATRLRKDVIRFFLVVIMIGFLEQWPDWRTLTNSDYRPIRGSSERKLSFLGAVARVLHFDKRRLQADPRKL